MRKVHISSPPPATWVAEAKIITKALKAAPNKAARKVIIDKNDGFWRDDRIRDWLLGQFNNKCWYTEADNNVSPVHIDHFRPKGRVKNLDGSYEDGYWWLSFDYNNYVVSGHYINCKKGDLFPILNGEMRAPVNCSDAILKFEGPVLINPLTDQTRLISYEREDDGGCIAVLSGGITDPSEQFKAEKTIEILGLNNKRLLRESRGDIWDKCLKDLKDYEGAQAQGAQALVWVQKHMALASLKDRIGYDETFSSVAEACIRKKAPEPVIAAVFER
jgi:hypothetical protein